MIDRVFQYQNSNENYQTVIDNFVIRKKEFERVINEIKNTGNEDSYQHFVFVGRRGSGKSTLLRRIQAEIETNPTLKENYIAINLGEEQSGIYRLFDLWDYVIRGLNAQNFGIAELNFRDYKNDLKAYNRKLHTQIIDSLRNANKRLVLMVDNIDRVLKNVDEDTAFLREVLMNYKEIRIIGGSTIMSEHFWKYDQPFYQFFAIKRLEALTLADIETLLTHWSKVMGIDDIKNIIHKYPGKIQSIRMLTDGSPRTMLLFVDMLLNRTEQNGYQYLQNIVDKATPIYQERLGILSPAQSKVITELAFLWDSAYVEQLIQPCNMEGKTISALLNQLVSQRIVEKIDTGTKNKLYRIEERFFNLWLNMTQGGPQQRYEAKALSSFLENWYDQTELHGLAKEFTATLQLGNLKTDYAQSMGVALLYSKVVDKSIKQSLIFELAKYQQNIPESLKKDVFGDFDLALEEAFEKGDYEKVIEILQIADLEEGKKYFTLGSAYHSLKNYELAEKCYLNAIEKGIVDALNNLAVMYHDTFNIEKAEKYYLEAIERGNKFSSYNLANLYLEKGNKELAEKYYIKSIKMGDIDSLNNLANLYTEKGDIENAKKYYLEAKENGNVNAIYNLALLFEKNGDSENAEKCYLNAIEKGNIKALNNLLLIYYNEPNRRKIKDLINTSIKDQLNEINPEVLILLLVYIGEVNEFYSKYNAYLKQMELKLFSNKFIFHLLGHHQTDLVYEYFEKNENAKEEYKGLYYALLTIIGHNDVIKMPPELAELTTDIINGIKIQQELYYPHLKK